MNRYIPALLLLGATLTAAAGESPSSQWKYVGMSLHDLTQDGYNIVSVTSDVFSNGVSVETFFLQKGNSASKCSETHATDVKAKKSTAHFMCWELVKPYGSARSK